jgi:hypothetical protein
MAIKKVVKKNEGMNVAQDVAIGAGVAALAAAGYFLFGPNGKKNRKQIKGWTVKAKGEVLEKIEQMKEVTKESYKAAVEEVTANYAKLKHVAPEEAKRLAAELIRHWSAIERDYAPKKKSAKKSTSKAKSKSKK